MYEVNGHVTLLKNMENETSQYLRNITLAELNFSSQWVKYSDFRVVWQGLKDLPEKRQIDQDVLIKNQTWFEIFNNTLPCLP